MSALVVRAAAMRRLLSCGAASRVVLPHRIRGLGAWRIPALPLVALLAAAVSGCAALGPHPARDSVAHYTGRAPESVFYRSDTQTLYFEYRTEDGPVYLVASAVSGQDGGGDGEDGDRPGVARLDVGAAPGAADERDAANALRPVRLMSEGDWSRLVKATLADLAPASSGEAALIAVQGRDFAVHREASGALRMHPHADKPSELRVVRFVGEAEFAARAMSEVARQAAAPADGASPASLVLYPAGGIATGGSFVFFDLDAGRSLFVVGATAPADPRGDAALGFTLRMADALVLRSHVLEPLMRPVTTIARLLKSVVHTVMAWMPQGASEVPVPVPPLLQAPGMDLQAWERRLDELAASPSLRGTVVPLIDGEAFFGALVQAIQEARESIDVRLYIFDTDAYALSIADLLKRRSHELRVRVMVDQIGSLAAGLAPPTSPGGIESARRTAGTVSIVEYLSRDSRIEVRSSPNPWLTSDHTKVIVVDGRTAFTGGMNIGYEYRYDWHDLMVELRGPIVRRLAADFDRQWAYTGLFGDLAYLFRLLRDDLDVANDEEHGDHVELRPLYTGIVGTEILNAQLEAIERARRYIWVEHSYLSDDAVIAALARARRRGVDVRVILPTRNDSGFMGSANLVAANVLLASGVRVFAYPGMTHVKAAIFDGWACFGSANFDKLSLRINLETNLASSDPRLVERLARELFDADFARSREITTPFSLGWSTYIASFVADQL